MEEANNPSGELAPPSIEDRFEALLSPEGLDKDEEEEDQPQEQSEESDEPESDDTPEEEQAETEEEPEEAGLVEVEYEGEKYEVPEALKDALLRQADYTKKTTEIAEREKAVQASYQQLQQQAAIQQQHLAEVAQLMNLDERVQAYDAVDWNTLLDSDPVEFVRQREIFRDLQANRDKLANHLGAIQQQTLAEQQAYQAKLISEGKASLERDIKGWNGDLARSLSTYGTELGFSPEEMAQVLDPRQVKVLHKAYLYDQLQKSKPETTKKVVNLPKVSKPGSNRNIAQEADVTMRKQLKKSGSIDDAAALFLQRMNRK